MGVKSGDKARYYRGRRKRNLRRMRIRELRAALRDKSATAETARPTAAPEST